MRPKPSQAPGYWLAALTNAAATQPATTVVPSVDEPCERCESAEQALVRLSYYDLSLFIVVCVVFSWGPPEDELSNRVENHKNHHLFIRNQLLMMIDCEETSMRSLEKVNKRNLEMSLRNCRGLDLRVGRPGMQQLIPQLSSCMTAVKIVLAVTDRAPPMVWRYWTNCSRELKNSSATY